MSWYTKVNGSHFGLPPRSIHKMTGLGGKWCELWRIRTGFIQLFSGVSGPESSWARMVGSITVCRHDITAIATSLWLTAQILTSTWSFFKKIQLYCDWKVSYQCEHTSVSLHSMFRLLDINSQQWRPVLLDGSRLCTSMKRLIRKRSVYSRHRRSWRTVVFHSR